MKSVKESNLYPVVKMWEEITPYLLKMNRSYQGVF
jgi:hypothetical protein